MPAALTPMPAMPSGPASARALARLDTIRDARRSVLVERQPSGLVPAWVERSWLRCLQLGLEPQREVVFQAHSAAHMRHTLEANAPLIEAARPLMGHLGRAIANTGYFAILTNTQGVVIDVSGPIDRSDRRADLITRIGTDLSEASVGTTAIGSTLAEQQSVWLHRGEHFFANTSVYSCAGAPLLGPDGSCIGMLDVTGIEAVERPELKHLVSQVAGKIENALVLRQAHRLLVRLNWPGNTLGGDGDGLVCLDAEGFITASNQAARQMLPGLATPGAPLHASEVLGMDHAVLFDASHHRSVVDVPLWSGLRLQAMPVAPALHAQAGEPVLRPPLRAALGSGASGQPHGGLKDIETALIHQAVEQARGNVAKAAQMLGISRATVYRKLGKK